MYIFVYDVDQVTHSYVPPQKTHVSTSDRDSKIDVLQKKFILTNIATREAPIADAKTVKKKCRCEGLEEISVERNEHLEKVIQTGANLENATPKVLICNFACEYSKNSEQF